MEALYTNKPTSKIIFLFTRMTFAAALVLLALCSAVHGGDPVFDPSTLMRLVLVPADAAVGSVIYRVRASDPDFDYPLHFELIGKPDLFK
ncbi:jg16183 [Pararge aegeria aegeria]|uniref:Jg16183 protein n=1 Tax=Pararge aegeria aegeria TaxID=348720 RepID=A0A8S4RAL4_9NEOP|nr:jg16183 [Pararge aegeria aegeria]